MIQRQQTLWLLLAAIASFLTYKLPFYTGITMNDNMAVAADLDGGSKFYLLILTGISVLISGITIFLYKDRKTQLKLSVSGLILSIILLVIYIMDMTKFTSGTLALSSLLVPAIIVGYAFAARGIHKDEKLVKSLDKLR